MGNTVYKLWLGQSFFGKSSRIFLLGFVLGLVRPKPRHNSYTKPLPPIKQKFCWPWKTKRNKLKKTSCERNLKCGIDKLNRILNQMEMDFLPAKCKTENFWFFYRNETRKIIAPKFTRTEKTRRKEIEFFFGFLGQSPKICIYRRNPIWNEKNRNRIQKTVKTFNRNWLF